MGGVGKVNVKGICYSLKNFNFSHQKCISIFLTKTSMLYVNIINNMCDVSFLTVLKYYLITISIKNPRKI